MEYVWFDDARVVAADLELFSSSWTAVSLPLPIVILHPDCALTGDGDVGRLGVPRWWAAERGLCA